MTCTDDIYAIEPGTDVAAPTLITDLITDNPTTNPDQLAPYMGPVRRVALDQSVTFNGTININWTWGGITFADFLILVNHVWGGHTVGSIPVTIYSRDVNNIFQRYNAVAVYPYPGQYQREFGGVLTNFSFQLRNLRQATGGFSNGFSFGFRV